MRPGLFLFDSRNHVDEIAILDRWQTRFVIHKCPAARSERTRPPNTPSRNKSRIGGNIKDAADAQAADITSHEVLLRLTVKGLWEQRLKQTVLAGYMPGVENPSACLLFLVSLRPLVWNAFSKCAQKVAGYIESGQDCLIGSDRSLLVWWEYPCTMIALWPSPESGVVLAPSDDAAGKSNPEHSWF